ncbi:deoxyribodipyrimidine photo-lyase [mine drainage metagenome]|uniref:Deoxyribodipyrimidine photo-lyase n=1 Tax=mine drainage metagenome TaxID=410659 RepID=A0A1J5QF39_9ZZZZ
MQNPSTAKALVWFRRDLRDFDHTALSYALQSARQVYCAFIFDSDILDQLIDKVDRRVEFIWECVRELKLALQQKGGELIVLHGPARAEIPALAKRLGVQAVHANRDYEPQPIARDAAVAEALTTDGVTFHLHQDQVIFESGQVLSQGGTPYQVFTPYKRAWLNQLAAADLEPREVAAYSPALARPPFPAALPSLEAMGFARTDLPGRMPCGMSGAAKLFEDFRRRIADYHAARDYPAVKGPSYLSVHLRFGTISIRSLASHARNTGGRGAETWLSELIWREFYFMQLGHRPELAAGRCFKPAFEHIRWPGREEHFQAWCRGQTGYPLVDAAMRQLDQSGYMHNRLRMLAASFLIKDLLVDWRRGEAWFAEKLLDFDLSANNGGWQWAASTGCDAQPWFRIFNPVTQSEKFDAQGKFIRRYVPELAPCSDREIHAPWKMSALRQRALGLIIGEDYPEPIVDHAAQRERALALYQQAGR